MRFVPTGDYWYQLPRLSAPDKKEREFLFCQGEFSVYRDEAFEKHIKRYPRLLKMFACLNGNKFKRILQEEPLWYQRAGLEKIINW